MTGCRGVGIAGLRGVGVSGGGDGLLDFGGSARLLFMSEFLAIRGMEIYKWSVEVADWSWYQAISWKPFARDVMGRQIVRALDSVAANLIEGGGRHGTADAIHFFIIARASAEEGIHWIERASHRGIVPESEAVDQIGKLRKVLAGINNLIAHRRKTR